ncbi:MAG: TonB-dependent receptor [Gammaproteobacteria bacterium]
MSIRRQVARRGSQRTWPFTLSLLACLPAVAADEVATATRGASYLDVGVVTVTAAREGALSTRDVLSSVDILGAERLNDQQVDNAWELFTRAPGVMTTDFNQGTTSGKLSFRAFNGEGEINAVKLLIDGIPANSNDGNMPFLDAVFPLDIEAIEVVRGTNDARYGLNNIAGNAQIVTRTGGNYTRGRLSYGSYDTVDAQVAAGLERGEFSQNYFLAYRGADGFREHSDFDKMAFAGKWFYQPDALPFRAGIIARWFENDAEEPGYLLRGDAERRPETSYAFSASDGGERQVGMVSGHLDVDLARGWFWTVKTYANMLDDVRWVQFSAGVAQQERQTEEVQYGALTTLTWRPQVAWLADLVVEGGLDVQQQDNQSERHLDVARVRTRQTRDQVFDLTNYGGYLQTVIKPFDWLKLVPGFRVDRYDGAFTNLLDGSRADINDYGTIWQPKFAGVLSVIDGYDLYGNWGRSAQIGLAAGTYKIPPRNTDLDASINDGWEVGVKFQPWPWLNGRVAYWEQVASDEVRRKLNDPTGDFDNVGATRRDGIDLQMNLQPRRELDLWFALSLQDAVVVTPGPTEPQLRGNDIDHTPDYVFSGGVDYRWATGWRASLWTYAQGDYYPERANSTEQFGDYWTLNMLVGWQVTRALGVELQVKNLTDEYSEYVWHDGAQTLHSPGDGRAVYGVVDVRFDY